MNVSIWIWRGMMEKIRVHNCYLSLRETCSAQRDFFITICLTYFTCPPPLGYRWLHSVSIHIRDISVCVTKWQFLCVILSFSSPPSVLDSFCLSGSSFLGTGLGFGKEAKIQSGITGLLVWTDKREMSNLGTVKYTLVTPNLALNVHTFALCPSSSLCLEPFYTGSSSTSCLKSSYPSEAHEALSFSSQHLHALS